jgi:1,4-alpha-glucan branching enzyme
VEITPITRGIARHQSICWLEASIIVSLRRTEDPSDLILFCCNFTPVPRQGHEFGVPEEGLHQEILDTDSELFGGTNKGNGNSAVPKYDRTAPLTGWRESPPAAGATRSAVRLRPPP